VRTPDWELLTGLPPEGVSEILGLASHTLVPKGDVLFRLGDEAKNLLLVRSGRVRLTFPMRIGNEQKDILAEERFPGQMIGWSALIPPHRFTLQAVATVEAELLVLPGQTLLRLFREKPQVGYTVLTNLAQIVGQRLTILQTMWIRELQRGVESHRA
jgi:CRP/FNR family cyclic AMP-dependent transcriptional regulator